MSQDARLLGRGPVVGNAAPRWRLYGGLARIDELPAIWTAVAAGAALSGSSVTITDIVPIGIALSLLAAAGALVDNGLERDRRAPDASSALAGAMMLALTLFSSGFVVMVGQSLLSSRPSPAAVVGSVALATTLVLRAASRRHEASAVMLGAVARVLTYLLAAASFSTSARGLLMACTIVVLHALACGGMQAAHRLGHASPRWAGTLLVTVCMLALPVVVTSAAGALAWSFLSIIVASLLCAPNERRIGLPDAPRVLAVSVVLVDAINAALAGHGIMSAAVLVAIPAMLFLGAPAKNTARI